jgi:nitrite reductase/ring-hydroxylating ferredoxin subunit/uncharacterized membrane protein
VSKQAPFASTPTLQAVQAQIDRIGKSQGLDQVADKLDQLVRQPLSKPPVRNALSGAWLGHRLHPVLTDVAIGSFTSAVLVDILAPRHPHIARRLIGVGIVSAVPTVASGLSDWVDVYGEPRRVGLVHALSNSLALSLFTRSFLHRGRLHKKRGKRGGGRLSSLVGLVAMGVGGYLGGHLSYVQGVGVDHTAFEPEIEEWTDVAAEEAVPEDGHLVTNAGEVEVLLYRHEGTLRAIANRCSHAGWPLAPGKFEGGCVTCPQHGSVFSLKDGSVVGGPAASPQPCFEVRLRDGRVEVRS